MALKKFYDNEIFENNKRKDFTNRQKIFILVSNNKNTIGTFLPKNDVIREETR